MIRNVKGADTKELLESGKSKRWRNIEKVAVQKLVLIQAAIELEDLRIPPNNQLEDLKGKRKGQHSIRINSQYRVCFRWEDDGAYEVEIVDYHDEK